MLYSCNKNPSSESVKIEGDNKKELLLIGTFHYNNPGRDVAKTKSFDILNEESQTELDEISQKIKEFNPTKIFVEWPYDEQKGLDSLFQIYKEGQYFENDSLSDFYLKNEIFQLAFRVAKLSKHNEVRAIDYNNTDFPYDSLMTVISNNDPFELQNKIEKTIQTLTSDFDDKIAGGASLLELTYHMNTTGFRKMSNEFHNEIPLLAGNRDNFIGPYLTSEWFKRNLYMWSLIQKDVHDDDRIMVLLGASHAAIIKKFIDENDTWKVVELQDLMN